MEREPFLQLAHLTAPCAECPFLRVGGIRLTRSRVLDVGGNMLSRDGGGFPCHVAGKTQELGECASGAPHCAGALIFAEKNEVATQWMRIMERLRVYRVDLLRGGEGVFDTLEEMLRHALRMPASRSAPADASGTKTRPASAAPAATRPARRRASTAGHSRARGKPK